MSWMADYAQPLRHNSPQHISLHTLAKSLRSGAKLGIVHDLIDAAHHHDIPQLPLVKEAYSIYLSIAIIKANTIPRHLLDS